MCEPGEWAVLIYGDGFRPFYTTFEVMGAVGVGLGEVQMGRFGGHVQVPEVVIGLHVVNADALCAGGCFAGLCNGLSCLSFKSAILGLRERCNWIRAGRYDLDISPHA